MIHLFISKFLLDPGVSTKSDHRRAAHHVCMGKLTGCARILRCTNLFSYKQVAGNKSAAVRTLVIRSCVYVLRPQLGTWTLFHLKMLNGPLFPTVNKKSVGCFRKNKKLELLCIQTLGHWNVPCFSGRCLLQQRRRYSDNHYHFEK